MRIIAGTNKGRKLDTLPGMNTRPMTDQLKEAVFNVLGPYFDGGIVLDLFGGSAALTLEALSRGCESSYLVDASSEAIQIINKNVRNLNESNRVHIYHMDYKQALSLFSKMNLRFDYIFLDPPFRMNVLCEIIAFLCNNHMITENGNIICQYLRKNYIPTETENLKIIKTYAHADSGLTIYEFHLLEQPVN